MYAETGIFFKILYKCLYIGYIKYILLYMTIINEWNSVSGPAILFLLPVLTRFSQFPNPPHLFHPGTWHYFFLLVNFLLSSQCRYSATRNNFFLFIFFFFIFFFPGSTDSDSGSDSFLLLFSPFNPFILSISLLIPFYILFPAVWIPSIVPQKF